MTKIVFFKQNELIAGFEISGHTNEAEFNKDVLCAAISTASQMAVVGIVDELKIKANVKVADGYLKLELLKADIKDPEAQVLLKTCLRTLKQITKNKKSVKLEVKNV